MIKFCLMATAALGIIGGSALAQTSSTTSTQTTTSVPAAPVGAATIDTSSQRTVDSNGVVTDKTKVYTSGTSITPSGDMATTRKTTETTTVR
jgi:hypothetical protein